MRLRFKGPSISGNDYCHTVKEIALLINRRENTVTQMLRDKRPIYGVRVRFLKAPGKGAPYQIHRESFCKIQLKVR